MKVFKLCNETAADKCICHVGSAPTGLLSELLMNKGAAHRQQKKSSSLPTVNSISDAGEVEVRKERRDPPV